MRIRTVLIACVILGLNTPICTGGMFALFTGLANVPVATRSDGLMSRAPAGYLACHGTESKRKDDAQANTSNGCSNAKSCLSKMTETLKDRLLVGSLSHVSDMQVAPSLPAEMLSEGTHNTATVRASPHDTSVLLAAHIFVQRE